MERLDSKTSRMTVRVAGKALPHRTTRLPSRYYLQLLTSVPVLQKNPATY